jgi:glycosyltransferase involved in cell wall biosynthesis
MQHWPSVDIILPCYNPREGWAEVVAESVSNIRSLLPVGVLQQIILVNDGSIKGVTEQLVVSLRADVPELKYISYTENRGKGFAVRTGVKASTADVQIFTDVDFPYLDESVLTFYMKLANGEANVIIASRSHSYYDSLSGFRKALSLTLKRMNGLLFRLKESDTQGGLKGFDAAGKELFLRTTIDRYLFDLEFVQSVSKSELTLMALHVQLKPDVLLPSPGFSVLLKELGNFIRLLMIR